MTTGRVILDVAVILVAARIGAALFESFGQPGVIGEIVAGIALGPTLLGAFPGDPSARAVPGRGARRAPAHRPTRSRAVHVPVGWDLDLDLVRRRERAATLISIASIVVPFALGIALAAPHSTTPYAGGRPVLAVRAVRRGGALADGVPGPRPAARTSSGCPTRRRAASSCPPPRSTTSSGGACSRSRSRPSPPAAPGTTPGSWSRRRSSSAVVVVLLRPLLARLCRSRRRCSKASSSRCVLAGATPRRRSASTSVFGAFLAGVVMPRIAARVGRAAQPRRPRRRRRAARTDLLRQLGYGGRHPGPATRAISATSC